MSPILWPLCFHTLSTCPMLGSQSMNPDIWYTMQVGTNKTTIRDALSQWYPNRYSSVVTIRDSCSGPRCNPTCPETISLGGQTSGSWSVPVQTLVLSLVVLTAVCCVLAKASFWLWYVCVGLKQSGYLEGLRHSVEESNLQVTHMHCNV